MSCAVSQQTLSTPTLPLAELDLRGARQASGEDSVTHPPSETHRKKRARTKQSHLPSRYQCQSPTAAVCPGKRQCPTIHKPHAIPCRGCCAYTHHSDAPNRAAAGRHGHRGVARWVVPWHVSALPYQGSCSHLFLVPGGLRRREFETKRAGPLVWPLDDFQVDVVGMVGFVSCLVLAGYARAVGCGCG